MVLLMLYTPKDPLLMSIFEFVLVFNRKCIIFYKVECVMND